MAFDSWGSFGLNNEASGPPPGPPTLIADTGATLGHWTATDLSHGNATVGPAFNAIGDVTLTPADANYPQRDAVGPFDDTSYFSLASPNVFEQQTFSFAIIVRCDAVAGTPVISSNGAIGVHGWSLDAVPSAAYQPRTSVANAVFTAQAEGTNGRLGNVAVLMGGYDRVASIAYSQTNRQTVATTANAAFDTSYNGTAEFLGRAVVTGKALNGAVYEVLLTSDTPSQSLFNSWYDQVATNGSQAPLISNSTGVTGHWTAKDIAGGTSLVGPLWTPVGTVPLVAVDAAAFPRRQSVGPFSDSNYFTLPTSNPINVAAPFSCVVVVDCADFSNNPEVIGNGDFASTGWVGELISPNSPYTYIAGTGTQGDAVTVNTPTVLAFGYDGTAGTMQVNNGALYTGAAATLALASTLTTLGNDNALGFPLNGHIYEVWMSTQTPTKALFDAVYAEVVAAGATT